MELFLWGFPWLVGLGGGFPEQSPAVPRGIHVGRGILFPGRKSRAARLRENGRRAGEVAMGAVIMLIFAGIIEGYFRQAVNDLEWRLIIGWGLGAVVFAYFGTGGWWQALGRRNTP